MTTNLSTNKFDKTKATLTQADGPDVFFYADIGNCLLALTPTVPGVFSLRVTIQTLTLVPGEFQRWSSIGMEGLVDGCRIMFEYSRKAKGQPGWNSLVANPITTISINVLEWIGGTLSEA